MSRELRQMQDRLEQEKACYVLITCDHSSESGSMQVEMSRGGGPTELACYMVEGALSRLNEEMEEEHSELDGLAAL